MSDDSDDGRGRARRAKRPRRSRPSPVDPVAALREELRTLPGEWYVIHTYAGYEKRVKANLEQRAVSLNVEDFIYQAEVPAGRDRRRSRTASARTSVRTSSPATCWCAWT